MKRSALIILLAYCNLFCFCQNSISTDGTCTDAMAQNAIGRWIKSADIGSTGIRTNEAYSKLDEIHNMLLKIIPQPTGVDAVWHRAVGISYFGSKKQSKRKTADGEDVFEAVSLPHVIMYRYVSGFFAYRCDYSNNKILNRGYPGETGTWVRITANETEPSTGGAENSFLINGLPARLKLPVLETFKGYEVQGPGPGSRDRRVLIHRKGVLPYTPVTRKQYLLQCIAYSTKLFDGMIKVAEQMPVRSLEEQEREKKAKLDKFQKDFGNDPKRLKSTVDYYLSGYKTDQQMRAEQVDNAKRIKEREVKKLTDELEKTNSEGLLDSPAMISHRCRPKWLVNK